MKRDDIIALMIDEAEGTLPPEQRIVLDEALRHHPELRDELSSLRQTFESLRGDEPLTVPTHYFSTLLPTLRRRMENKRGRFPLWIPSWGGTWAAPLTAILIIGLVTSLYRLLENEPPDIQLYAILREAGQEELFDVSTGATTPFVRQQSENALSFLPEDNSIGTTVIADQLLASHSLYDNAITDNQILQQLNDQDIEVILDRLRDNAIQ